MLRACQPISQSAFQPRFERMLFGRRLARSFRGSLWPGLFTKPIWGLGAEKTGGREALVLLVSRVVSRNVLDLLFLDTLAFPPDRLSMDSTGCFGGGFDSMPFPTHYPLFHYSPGQSDATPGSRREPFVRRYEKI